MAFRVPSLATVRRRLARLRDRKVLVVGDVMLDRFVWGQVERISPEAPVPVVRVGRETSHLGGAGNVVHNAATLGVHVAVCGVVGTDAAGSRTRRDLRAIGASTRGLVSSRQTTTVCKTRVIAHNQQVVRFDHEPASFPRALNQKIGRWLARNTSQYDAIVVSDYGKGVVSKELLAQLPELLGAQTKLIIDPKYLNFDNYRGATLATPNSAEAEAASGIKVTSDASAVRAGRRLLQRWGAHSVLITRGEHGMTLVAADGSTEHFEAVSREVFDVTGAGDTVVAVCAAVLAAGGSASEAAWLANHAAGVAVGKLGTAIVTTTELLAAVRQGSRAARK